MSEVSSAETTAEKSFDVLASVKAYQFDLDTFGYIHPETRRRVRDEELTYIAEGINMPLYTEFVLHEENGQLVYFHEGKWRSYVGGLARNLTLAQQEAQSDPRRQFLAERAAEDLRIGYQIAALEPGQRLVFKSEFPQAECDLYGAKFISVLGFQPARRMGFVYQAEKTIDGRTVLYSQTVDGNEAEAYQAAMEAGQTGSIEDMVDAYDETMSTKYGGIFYAGRQKDESLPEQNSWDEIQKHTDLVDYLMGQVEAIARQGLSPEESESAKKRLTYGVWARLRERLDEHAVGIGSYEYTGGDSIGAQVESAYQSAAARSEVLFGCGGSITAENAILQASGKDTHNLIFGNQKKWFGCYYCGAKQYGDPCASTLYCPTCEARVVDGKVESTGKGRQRYGFFEVIAQEWTNEWRKWNENYDLDKAQKLAKENT